MLFPAKMVDEIERLPESYTYNMAKKHINYKRVSAITIRHYNFMILDSAIPEGVANFIQERSPENSQYLRNYFYSSSYFLIEQSFES